jgi:hypothetical protein
MTVFPAIAPAFFAVVDQHTRKCTARRFTPACPESYHISVAQCVESGGLVCGG